MEKEKKKIVRSCDNCALLKHSLCKRPGTKCSKWVNKKYTCRYCEFAGSCMLLGKNSPSCFGFCISFSKAEKRNSYKIFPDAEDYEKFLAEKRASKEEHSKKEFKGKKGKEPYKGPSPNGKKELFDEDDFPIKSPLVKVAKPKKLLDPTLQDKDRSEWSPMDKIEEIVARNYDPEAFALVDERDLPKSDNIVKFILEPAFLNQPLYPRQLQIILDFFAAYCPYCSDTNWIRNEIQVDTPTDNILDRTVLYSDGVCPKCGKTKYEAVKDNQHTTYASLVLAVGQRSGKTALLWMVSPAIIHEYLQIPNPAKFMRQLDVTELHATFVGVTAEDVYKNVWSPMDNVFTWSPWYRMYHEFLDAEGKRIGTELYRHMDTYIAYHHKGIYASSGNADFRKLRGKCITGDTLISTSIGTIPVKELHEKYSKNLPSIRNFTKDEPIVGIEKQPYTKEVVRIFFRGNHCIEVTTDHRIPCMSRDAGIELKEAKDLLGTYVMMQLGADFPKSYCFKSTPSPKDSRITFPKEITKELGELIGYLVSDCAWHSYSAISFTSSRKKTAKRVSGLVYSLFGYNPSFSVKYKTKEDNATYFCRIESKDVVQFFRWMLPEVSFPKRKLPDCIMQGTREAVISCLSALVDSSGGFVGNFPGVCYSLYFRAKSPLIREQILVLLSNLGYMSNNVGHEVHLSLYETVRFMEEYTGDRKCPPINLDDRQTYYQYTIPGTGIYIRSELNEKFGVTNIPRDFFMFLDKNICFLPVTRMMYIGKKEVYDLEIGSPIHLFPANSVLVHNTRLLSSIDEGAYLTGDKIMMNAWQAYDALNNSLSTLQTAYEKIFPRFPGAPSAYGLYTSSTRSKQDFIMGMYKRSKRVSNIYARKMATWEFNPNMPRDCDFIKTKYLEDYVIAERDYASNPPFASDPFIKRAAQIVPLLSKRGNVLSLDKIKITKDSLGGKAMYPTIKCIPHTYPCCLSIDAGWKCVARGTYVPTERGLLKIEEMEGMSNNLRVGFNEYAERWHSTGMKECLKIVTEHGYRLTSSKEHKILVFGPGGLQWVETEKLSIGDLLCIDLNQAVSNHALKLNLKVSKYKKTTTVGNSGYKNIYKRNGRYVVIITVAGKRIWKTADTLENAIAMRDSLLIKYNASRFMLDRVRPKVPKIMTPGLAYLLGAVVSEGHYGKYQVCITNFNRDFLLHCKDLFKSVFGVEARVGRKGLIVCSTIVCSFLAQMGLVNSTPKKAKKGIRPSIFKEVPPVIMRADKASQLAFVAAYVDGDGSVCYKRREVAVWSSSDKLLHQMKVMITSFGVLMKGNVNLLPKKIKYNTVRLDTTGRKCGGIHTATVVDGLKLHDLISPYMVISKKKKKMEPSDGWPKYYGIPFAPIKEFLSSRRIRKDEYMNDSGEKVRIKISIRKPEPKVLSYNADSEAFLMQIRKVSKRFYRDLRYLIDRKMRFSGVYNIKEVGLRKCYDLTMGKGSSHSYAANGLVVHNCNSFALALTHFIPDTDNPDNQLIATSGLLEITPREGIPISHNMVYEHVIRPILETYDVRLFVTDNWQGLDFQSRVFSDYDVDSTQYSLKYDDFTALRSRINSEAWVLPKLDGELKDVLSMDKDFEELVFKKPVSHLMIQLLVSKDTGRTVTKNTDAGEDFTDDLLRAAALGVAVVDSEEYGHMFQGEGIFSKRRPSVIGAVSGFSSASNTSSFAGLGALARNSGN